MRFEGSSKSCVGGVAVREKERDSGRKRKEIKRERESQAAELKCGKTKSKQSQV